MANRLHLRIVTDSVPRVGLYKSWVVNIDEGWTLVAFDSASEFAIGQFGLPVRNVVEGLSNTELYQFAKLMS